MKREDLYNGISGVRSEYLDEAENYKVIKKPHWKIWTASAACICLCLCCAFPALAATDNAFAYEVLYAVSPGIAQKLKPVNASCEDNGIEMNVIAAEIDGDKAAILVSMQDIAGSRLDETTDLFDSYSIHTPYDQAGGCSLVEYDAETKTAVFMISIEHMNRELIPGDKITFSVNQLLSKKKHSNIKLTQIDTSNLPLITDFADDSDIRGWSGAGEVPGAAGHPHLIIPDEDPAIVLENGVTLTGYGIVDNELHVQIKYDDIIRTDNHGDVYLKDQNGEISWCVNCYSFWEDGTKNSYYEYIFPVSADELCNYEIWGEFSTCSQGPINGNWQVTFPLKEKE